MKPTLRKAVILALCAALICSLASPALADGDAGDADAALSVEIPDSSEQPAGTSADDAAQDADAQDDAAQDAMAGTDGLPFDVSATSALLMEASTGMVLYAKNEHERLNPASVTKVMTLLLIMEALDDGRITYDDMVSVSERAAGMGGSQVYLSPGEQMSVHDLIKCIAVVSGNDASVAMAEHISGSEEVFVAKMNEKAAQLGMSDTVFKNCHGLTDDGHYTCAADIAKMSRALTAYPDIFGFTTIWMDSIRGGEFALSNTNKLIKTYPGATGLKTGSTDAAKWCLSATARRDGMDLIAVVLGSPSSAERFDAAAQLLDFGFATYTVVSEQGVTALPELVVIKGRQAGVAVEVTGEPISVVVPKGEDAPIEAVVEMQADVHAPVEKGQLVGEVNYMMNGLLVGTKKILTTQAVDRLGLLDMLELTFSRLFMISK